VAKHRRVGPERSGNTTPICGNANRSSAHLLQSCVSHGAAGQALQIFEFRGSEVRAILINGEPWFVARDVAHALSYGRTQEAIRHLDDDERRRWRIDTPLEDRGKVVLLSGPDSTVGAPRAHSECKDVSTLARPGGHSADHANGVLFGSTGTRAGGGRDAAPQNHPESLRMLAAQIEATGAAEARGAALEAAARAWEPSPVRAGTTPSVTPRRSCHGTRRSRLAASACSRPWSRWAWSSWKRSVAETPTNQGRSTSTPAG
jgi:hypothetical protein